MIQGLVFDRFVMGLGCLPDAQYIFLIGVAIASENLLKGLR